MDLTALRYFVAVAEVESVTEAAARVPISPGSLTKAVQKLEAELGVKLFERVGRRIRLAPEGRALLPRARELLRREEEIRLELGGGAQAARLRLGGEEALLGAYGVPVLEEVLAARPGVTFELRGGPPDEALAALRRGELQGVLSTQAPPADCWARDLGEEVFVTCVGRAHPLARRRKPVPIVELLGQGFVVPFGPFLGRVGERQSHDGWRDDAFPRRVVVVAETLHQLLAVVAQGLAVAYLPGSLAEAAGLRVLEVTGCEYTCVQPVSLLVHPGTAPAWLRDLMEAGGAAGA